MMYVFLTWRVLTPMLFFRVTLRILTARTSKGKKGTISKK